MSSVLPVVLALSLLSPQVPDSIGDGGPATEAVLVAPGGVALDTSGNIYISERAANRIRRVRAETGVIETLIRGLSTPTDLAADGAGHIYIADTGNHRILRLDPVTGDTATVVGTGEPGFAGDGGPASRALLLGPFGVTVDGAGNLYVADTENHRIRRVDAATGTIRTVAGNGEPNFAGDGGPAVEASLARPHRIVVTDRGDLIIGDSFNFRIRRVDGRTGVIRTILGTGRMGVGGDGGPGVEATMTYSGGLALDRAGDLVFTDLAAHRIRRVDLESGRVTSVAGTGEWGFAGDGGRASGAELHLPGDITRAPNGDLLFTDMWNGRVRRLRASDGVIETVAGSRPTPATPQVSFHFHYEPEAIRADLDAPVAVSDPGAEGVELRPLAGIELYAPPEDAGPAPLVVLLHGRNNYEFDPLDWGGLESWARLLAARGLAAAVVSHPLGSQPRSLVMAEADVRKALSELRGSAEELGVDGDRVCLLSFRGGSTLLSPYLEDSPGWVRCLAAFHPHLNLEPPAIWDWYLEDPGIRADYALAPRVGPDSPPIFMALGEDDSEAVTAALAGFVQAARSHGVTVEVARHPSGGADFERLNPDDESRRIVEEALSFLEAHLAPASTATPPGARRGEPSPG